MENFEKVNPYTAECESLARCIIEGRQRVDVNGPERSLHILRVVEAAYQSSRTDRFVDVC